jgi:hypothetical protein
MKPRAPSSKKAESGGRKRVHRERELWFIVVASAGLVRGASPKCLRLRRGGVRLGESLERDKLLTGTTKPSHDVESSIAAIITSKYASIEFVVAHMS